MAGLARPRVDVASVEPVRPGQRQRERRTVVGSEDQMDVVRHQAIGPAGDAEAPAGFGEPVLVERIVAVLEENPLAAIAALGDVMGQARDDDAGDAGHGRTIAEMRQLVNTGVSP